MTKKMRELQAAILAKIDEAKGYMEGENKDLNKAEALMNEVDELQKEFDTLERIEKANKGKVPTDAPGVGGTDDKVDGFKLMGKLMSKKALNDTEKAALVTGTSADNGTTLLVPEDVKVAINELRKTYVSAKELVTVEPTDSLAGSSNYEDGTPSGLVEFEDGAALTEDDDVAFRPVKFAIKWFGKLIPVSRILAKAEKAGLMSYLDRWFVKNAVISENGKIFETLKAGYNGGTPKAVKGWAALKKSITVDLDPSALIGGVIATNQSGFACLDEETDANGRPILTPNPANPTEKMFQGLPIKVYPDAQLPNISGTEFPIFYGNTKAGATFEEHQALEFAISEHFLFNKNQNCLRVVEGFDVMSTDTGSYVYGSFSATAKA